MTQSMFQLLVALLGRGPCPGVYLVSSRARLFSGISPCAGPWCISPRGEAARGAGELVPPPLPPTLQLPYFSSPAPSALLPLPGMAGGSARVLSAGSRAEKRYVAGDGKGVVTGSIVIAATAPACSTPEAAGPAINYNYPLPRRRLPACATTRARPSHGGGPASPAIRQVLRATSQRVRGRTP